MRQGKAIRVQDAVVHRFQRLSLAAGDGVLAIVVVAHVARLAVRVVVAVALALAQGQLLRGRVVALLAQLRGLDEAVARLLARLLRLDVRRQPALPLRRARADVRAGVAQLVFVAELAAALAGRPVDGSTEGKLVESDKQKREAAAHHRW